jgi:hypothetical protein
MRSKLFVFLGFILLFSFVSAFPSGAGAQPREMRFQRVASFPTFLNTDMVRYTGAEPESGLMKMEHILMNYLVLPPLPGG